MHNGYQRNEFDTSKFTLSYNSQKLNGFASKSQLDVFTGQNFGLDPDAPLFVNYPYGPGGLPLDQGMCRVYIVNWICGNVKISAEVFETCVITK